MAEFKEQGAKIDGYENYAIYRNGVVINTLTGKARKPCKNAKGYLYIGLCKDGVVHNHFLHRLLAKAFIANPNDYPTVDHIDRNILNNSLDNLRWATMSTQIKNQNKRRLCHRKGHSSPLRKAVMQVKGGETINVYESCLKAEKETGISNGHISKCCRGIRKTAGGYEWRYI